MSQTGDSNGRGDDPRAPREVLTNLPRTRPQRVSARRTAARDAASPKPARPAKPAGTRPKSTAKRAGASSRAASGAKEAKAAPQTPPSRSGAPAQGFDADTSRSVEPPSGADMLIAAVEAAGELAQAGVNLGKGLLKGALSRLPRP